MLGGIGHFSWVIGSLTILAFVICGTALRGLRAGVGKFWIGFAFCLICSAIFSISRSESVGLLQDYLPKVFSIYFFCCAFALTIRSCRTLFTANVLCTTAMLFSSLLYGGVDRDGRFAIQDSLFFSNANDFALALVCNLGFSVYLLCKDSIALRILGAAEFLGSLYFMLKTGSRGGFLALAACMLTWLLFFKHRTRLLAVILPGVFLLGFLPSNVLDRLVHIRVPGTIDLEGNTNGEELSQAERTLVFEKSVSIAVHHPLFGTGPLTFMDALWDDDVANGTHTHALGTHNSYTQLAAEDGFIVLILYLGALFGSIRANYKVMKRTRGIPHAQGVYIMAGCLLGSLIAYAVGTTFDHVAYSGTLPLLSGLSVALYLASRGGDPVWIEQEVLAGNA